MKLDKVVEVLLVIGGLCLGIMAAFDFNFLEAWFGYRSPMLFISYGLIGIAAVVKIIKYLHAKAK
jgi:uncharacterized membrane protein YuzA (DUF378 family)